MAKQRRRTIAHNPLDGLASVAPAIGLDDDSGRPRGRRRRTRENDASPARDEVATEKPGAAAEGGACWMWWVGAGLVALVFLA